MDYASTDSELIKIFENTSKKNAVKKLMQQSKKGIPFVTWNVAKKWLKDSGIRSFRKSKVVRKSDGGDEKYYYYRHVFVLGADLTEASFESTHNLQAIIFGALRKLKSSVRFHSLTSIRTTATDQEVCSHFVTIK